MPINSESKKHNATNLNTLKFPAGRGVESIIPMIKKKRCTTLKKMHNYVSQHARVDAIMLRQLPPKTCHPVVALNQMAVKCCATRELAIVDTMSHNYTQRARECLVATGTLFLYADRREQTPPRARTPFGISKIWRRQIGVEQKPAVELRLGNQECCLSSRWTRPLCV